MYVVVKTFNYVYTISQTLRKAENDEKHNWILSTCGTSRSIFCKAHAPRGQRNER